MQIKTIDDKLMYINIIIDKDIIPSLMTLKGV
jgi:hypothetical protein